MAAKTRPYEQFGPYILFKKLEADALGELWRAARLEGEQLGPLVALRRLSGGDRAAMVAAANEAATVVPMLSGTSFVKQQVVGVEGGVPFIAYDYSGGRSLRHIVDRARGGTNAAPNPIPLDQAVLIADRIALSLATLNDMRMEGNRLTHGALIPQFVWITDDGEVRVAGQHLAKGINASLTDTRVAADIGRFFAPERASGKASDVYSMGALLFLLVTGHEPPDPLSVTAFTQTTRAAKTMGGQQIPLEIRTILDKSLILDPTMRYASINDMKQALATTAAKYSATTFNLAFYLSTLLKKEMESEALEREKESKVNAAMLSAPAVLPAPAEVGGATSTSSKKKPMAVVATIAAAAAASIAGVFVLVRHPQPKPAQVAAAVTTPPPAQPKPEPILAQPVIAATAPLTSTTATIDPEAQKKAFEDAVNQKLQAEMLKLQSQFTKNLQKKNAKNAPVPTEEPAPAPAVAVAQPAPAPAPVPVPAPAAAEPSAAALDQQRLAARQPEPAPQPVVQPAQPAAPQPAAVQEGDVVNIQDLDVTPKPVRQPQATYPPMALKQRVQTSVIVTALVDENGDVVEVHILRGDPRFGFNEAALRALRGAKFTPPVKDGKRVKTWFPQTVNFKL